MVTWQVSSTAFSTNNYRVSIHSPVVEGTGLDSWLPVIEGTSLDFRLPVVEGTGLLSILVIEGSTLVVMLSPSPGVLMAAFAVVAISAAFVTSSNCSPLSETPSSVEPVCVCEYVNRVRTLKWYVAIIIDLLAKIHIQHKMNYVFQQVNWSYSVCGINSTKNQYR